MIGDGLRLAIDGVRNDRGQIVVMAFDDAEAFEAVDADRAVESVELPARPERLLADFPDLVAGPYAIFIWHDEDGDYDLDMAGDTPLEGYSWSGAFDRLAWPDFKRAAIGLGEHTVAVIYLD